jgi:hypothetical protein
MPIRKNISKKDMEREEHITLKEKQDRLDDLDQALKIYREICSRSDQVSPIIDTMIQNITKLQQYCKKIPALRAIYLNQKLSIDLLTRLLLNSKSQLFEFKKVSERTRRNLDGIENDILDPKLLK